MGRWNDQPITGAINPSRSPFRQNQIVFVPGIGPMKLSDVGDVPGIDIPVQSRREMFSPQFNRYVNVGGHNVKLTAYIPGNRALDPKGGGKLDAFGNPIIPYGGNPVPERPSGGEITDNPFAAGYPSHELGSSPGEVTDNPFYGGYPEQSTPERSSPGEITDNPFIGGYSEPYLPGGETFSSPGEITDNPFYGGYPEQYVPETSSPGSVTDNPFAGGYPEQPAPTEPSSPGEITDNPFAGGYPSNETGSSPGEITDNPFMVDMPTEVAQAPSSEQYASEPPMPTGSVPLPTSSSPPLQVINDLGYNPSYPYGSSGSGVPTQQGAGILGGLIGGGLGGFLLPGIGGFIGNRLGSTGARMLARFLQGQAMNKDQSGSTIIVQPADQGNGGSYDPFGGLPPGFVEGNRNYQGGPNEFTQTGGAPTFYNPAGYMGGSSPGGSFFGGQSNIFYGNPGDPHNGMFIPGMGPLDIPGGGNLGPLFGGGSGLSNLTLGSGGGRTGQGLYGWFLGSGSGAGGANKVSPLGWT